MSRFIVALLFPLLAGCISLPTRTPPPATYEIDDSSLGTAAVIGCEGSFGENMSSDVCLFRLTLLAEVLSNLKIFNSVTVGSQDSADFLINVKAAPYRPYQMSLGHNPAVLLLSAAIPFWQKSDYGVELEIADARTSEMYRVNTIYEAHDVYWSGSMLLNLSSSRGLPETHAESERRYLRNSIINALAHRAPKHD